MSQSDRLAVWVETRIIIDKKPRYGWGGAVAEEKGLDCSGFVYLVFKRAGFVVGRTTARNMRLGYSGWHGADAVDGQFQVGDLVFWTWRDQPQRPDGHVGIIMQTGVVEMVAHSSARRGVVLDGIEGVFLEDISARIILKIRR